MDVAPLELSISKVGNKMLYKREETSNVPNCRDRRQRRGRCGPGNAVAPAEGAVVVQRVEEHLSLVVDETPERLGELPDAVLLPLLVAVVQKGAEETRVEVVQYEGQEVLVELERVGKLVGDLPHAVDELQEDRRPIVVVVLVLAMTHTVAELVAETQPLFLNQELEAGECPVEGIKEQHGEGRELGCPVPSVGAVNDHRRLVLLHFMCDPENRLIPS